MRLCQDNPSLQQTGRLVLADGTVYEGTGLGAAGHVAGEVCFNTAMTGYQEILSDPSYAKQIITFTFPHIGNVGVNKEDNENASDSASIAAVGTILRAEVTAPSNYRARLDLPAWLKRRGIIGLSGIDTRALTAHIRDHGMPHGVIAHNPSGHFDIPKLQDIAAKWAGIEGQDLAKEVTTPKPFSHNQTPWRWQKGYGALPADSTYPHIVVMDFGVKKNILRCLSDIGCRVTVVPAQSSYEDISALAPDGIVLSNGPGDPAATGRYAVPVVQKFIAQQMPIMGICLGHQILSLAMGAQTKKMIQGHHGANHPVKDDETQKVEIVSMNHGFTVDTNSLPENVCATHTSLFDGTNCGLRLLDSPAFSVQHHPEASPGPQDSFYLFERFRQALIA
ncbi:MAG: glutamine-hydrolyzing carbamoyl-phosphate synthase small subunit [bacterium]